MEDEIITKLNTILSKSITEECQVFYIIGQIRKLIEHLNHRGSKRYLLLKAYCNWVLHVKICDKSQFGKILEKADNDPDKMSNFVRLEHLKYELSNFLKEFKLLNNIMIETERWEDFRDLLYEILIDTPFIEPTNSIKSFSLKRSKMKSSLKCAISWTVDYKNGAKASGDVGKI